MEISQSHIYIYTQKYWKPKNVKKCTTQNRKWPDKKQGNPNNFVRMLAQKPFQPATLKMSYTP